MINCVKPTCQYCGRRIGIEDSQCTGEQHYVVDPFLAEIHEEYEYVWLCHGQHEELSWEI